MFLVNFFLAFKAFFLAAKFGLAGQGLNPPPLPRGFPSWNVANPGSNQVQNKIVATKSQNSQLSKKNHFRLQSFFDSNHYFLTQNLPWQSFHDTFLDNFWPIEKKFLIPRDNPFGPCKDSHLYVYMHIAHLLKIQLLAGESSQWRQHGAGLNRGFEEPAHLWTEKGQNQSGSDTYWFRDSPQADFFGRHEGVWLTPNPKNTIRIPRKKIDHWRTFQK